MSLRQAQHSVRVEQVEQERHMPVVGVRVVRVVRVRVVRVGRRGQCARAAQHLVGEGGRLVAGTPCAVAGLYCKLS